ncbi:hypothetical protein MNBD_UNCLBAC01-2160 [hydrothermal vent metagenome]|uniref:Uncharacterized protein n=1 Tax=hydrothermal vent metagenome TaxID=652676 RepID=A0A3B1D0C5_9ZZZZ
MIGGLPIEDTVKALDTTTFLILALGPQGVKDELGINPDDLIDKTKGIFGVTVNMLNIGRISGFDFTDPYFRNPMVWFEGTAQMAVIFSEMSKWHDSLGNFEKAAYYEQEWKFYLGELKKAERIYSDGRTGVPYASHGGMLTFPVGGFNVAERGSDGQLPSSIDSGTWKIYAEKRYNPMGESSSPINQKVEINGVNNQIQAPETKGGIDFNPNRMNIEERGQGVKFDIPLMDMTGSPITIENLQNATGFEPMIINITPITNLPFLLGLDSEDFLDEPANEEKMTIYPEAAMIEPKRIKILS